MTRKIRGRQLSKIEEESLPKDMEEVYTNLVEKAPFVRGDGAQFTSLEDLPWFDETLFRKGVDVLTKKYLLLFHAMQVAGHVFSTCAKPMSSVFYRLGMYFDKETGEMTYIKRGAQVAMFEYKFLKDCLKDLGNTVKKTALLLRKRHQVIVNLTPEHDLLPLASAAIEPEYHQLAQDVREDLKELVLPPMDNDSVSWHPPLPFSQYLVGVTSFGLFSLYWLHPVLSQFVPEEDKLALLHVWALFGRMTGQYDEYNPALYPNSELYKKYYERGVLVYLKDLDGTGAKFLKMALDKVQANTFGFMRGYVILYMLLEISGVEPKTIKSKMSLLDNIFLRIQIISLHMYLRLGIVRFILNKLVVVYYWLGIPNK